MKLNPLQIDLLKKHLGPFLFCFFGVMFVLLMQFLVLHIDKLIGKDIPLGVILELIITNLAYMVVLAAPMAVLVASLMAFGKFSEHNELTALRASGVNTLQIIMPVLIASVLLSAGLMWFSNAVLPEANSKARSLFIDIRLKKPGFELEPNVFYDGIEGYTFLVDRIDPVSDTLYHITLFQEPTNLQNRAYIKADKGFLTSEGTEALTLHLFDGEILRYPSKRAATRDRNMEQIKFQKHRKTFDLSDLAFNRSVGSSSSRSDRTMSIQAMAFVVDTLEQEIKELRYQIVEDSISTLHPATFNQGAASTKPTKSGHIAQSNLFILNQVGSITQQIRLANLGYSQVENAQSQIERAKSNELWRVKRIQRYWVEIHKKFSIPFACIIFVLLGAPIGILTRKGNVGYAAIIASILLTVYWISVIQGEKLADRLFISPFWGMWSFNLFYMMIGFLLLLHLSYDLRSLLPNKSDRVTE
jgi:lipopolysaccharide export system permease protein